MIKIKCIQLLAARWLPTWDVRPLLLFLSLHPFMLPVLLFPPAPGPKLHLLLLVPSTPPLHNPQVLSRLKESTNTFVKLDKDALARARMRFQYSLYGKFFGKPPPFEQEKNALLVKWADLGNIQISNLPNGFLLIRCATESTMQRLLLDGPWSINGLILQLSAWQPFFEPVHAKLDTAAIWVQLHNLPVDFWDGETLEIITSHMGHLLKIDELTASLARSKFARTCIKIDLSKPLCRGFWVGFDEQRVFVVVMYERLPTFCYTCGMIGHGSDSCAGSSSTGPSSSPLPPGVLSGLVEGTGRSPGDHDRGVQERDP